MECHLNIPMTSSSPYGIHTHRMASLSGFLLIGDYMIMKATIWKTTLCRLYADSMPTICGLYADYMPTIITPDPSEDPACSIVFMTIYGIADPEIYCPRTRFPPTYVKYTFKCSNIRWKKVYSNHTLSSYFKYTLSGLRVYFMVIICSILWLQQQYSLSVLLVGERGGHRINPNVTTDKLQCSRFNVLF